eukprot:3179888-Pyramimonas_sp.AAC.1
MSPETVDAMTEHQLFENLAHSGFLTDWTQQFRPHCGKYSVGTLRKRSATGTWCYRCTTRTTAIILLSRIITIWKSVLAQEEAASRLRRR